MKALVSSCQQSNPINICYLCRIHRDVNDLDLVSKRVECRLTKITWGRHQKRPSCTHVGHFCRSKNSHLGFLLVSALQFCSLLINHFEIRFCLFILSIFNISIGTFFNFRFLLHRMMNWAWLSCGFDIWRCHPGLQQKRITILWHFQWFNSSNVNNHYAVLKCEGHSYEVVATMSKTFQIFI